tara:strand:+ start:348 stop:758 length:411 start_codon:yes stop_codon:yes gene_type:complete
MEIHLAYKKYPYKLTLNACKVFFEQTGLDLQIVFLKYISLAANNRDSTIADRLIAFSELYSRDVACKAMHCMIKEVNSSVPIAEIQDATYRVGWMASDRDDDLSEPWSMVMVSTALQINDYFSEGLNVKKLATSEE